MESLKTLGLASIKSTLTNIFLKTKDDITNFDDQNKKTKKLMFSKFFDDLLANLSPTFLRFGLNSVGNTTKIF